MSTGKRRKSSEMWQSQGTNSSGRERSKFLSEPQSRTWTDLAGERHGGLVYSSWMGIAVQKVKMKWTWMKPFH